MPRSPKKHPTGDYEVGYGRPPRSGQFKPGQSGNPKGRKKREETISGALRAELAATQKVRENGKEKTLSKAEILAKQWVRQGMEGKQRAVPEIAKLESRFLSQAVAAVAASAEPRETSGGELTQTDVAMLKWFVQGLESENAEGAVTEDNVDPAAESASD